MEIDNENLKSETDEKNSIPDIPFGDSEPLKTAEKPSPLKKYYGPVPFWIMDSGVLEILMPKAAKLLLVLVRRAYFKTGNGRISNKNIAKVAGICLSSVPGYMRELKFFGIIKTWRHGWVRYYQIQFEPPPDIAEKVAERYFDKCPKNSDTYRQDKTTGKFIRKHNPKKSEVASMKFSDVA